MDQLINAVEANLKEDIPEIRPGGDTVRVNVKVVEGEGSKDEKGYKLLKVLLLK